MMRIQITGIDLLREFFQSLKSKGFELPSFQRSSEVIVFSDYAGERNEDSYKSYSFLILDKLSSLEVCHKIIELRETEREWKDGSFIEYKKMGDKVRSRILPRFLKIFDDVEGMILTVLIDKKSPHYFTRVTHKEAKKIEELGLGRWKVHILRKISDVLSILSFLEKYFLDEKTSIIWYSDRDDIFGAHQTKSVETLEMLSKFRQVFEAKQKPLKYIFDNHLILNSDFLAVADLACGGVLEYYQRTQKKVPLKESTEQIMGWLSSNNSKLKKFMLVGQVEESNKQLIAMINY